MQVTEKEIDSAKRTIIDNDYEEMKYEESIEENLGGTQESDTEPAIEEFSEKSKILLRLHRQVQIWKVVIQIL